MKKFEIFLLPFEMKDGCNPNKEGTVANLFFDIASTTSIIKQSTYKKKFITCLY